MYYRAYIAVHLLLRVKIKEITRDRNFVDFGILDQKNWFLLDVCKNHDRIQIIEQLCQEKFFCKLKIEEVIVFQNLVDYRLLGNLSLVREGIVGYFWTR